MSTKQQPSRQLITQVERVRQRLERGIGILKAILGELEKYRRGSRMIPAVSSKSAPFRVKTIRTRLMIRVSSVAGIQGWGQARPGRPAHRK